MPRITTVCRFNSGPRAGTSFDFQPYGVQPIPVGAPCTDGQGSNGVAVASSGSGDLPSQGAVPLTTVCRLNSGPRAGTFFDFRPYGVQPIPVNAPCTDGQGSNGVAVASSGSGDLPSQGAVPLTTVCRFNSGPRVHTFFDFRPYGVQPIPVGAPCTDGQGSNGVAVASSGSGGGEIRVFGEVREVCCHQDPRRRME